MRSLLSIPVLLILAILFACSESPSVDESGVVATGPAPTEEPAGTESLLPTKERNGKGTALPTGAKRAAAAPTIASMATPDPSPTPEPTATLPKTPEGESSAGVLSPLNLHDPMFDDPESVNALLSEPELACLRDIGPVMHRRWTWILPGYGNQEERARIIGCLGDETIARIFLADTAEGVGPLSLETSTCVRAAFKEIDPRRVMLAKVEGFPGDTLNSATTLHFATIACLSDEEWETAAEWVREAPELREWMQCIMGKLGGPGEMAVAMTKDGRSDREALSEAAGDCAEEMASAPGKTPVAQAATPEPASTPEP